METMLMEYKEGSNEFKVKIPKDYHGTILFENEYDYISDVDGKRVMFDKITNLEVNKENWKAIEDSRPFDKILRSFYGKSKE